MKRFFLLILLIVSSIVSCEGAKENPKPKTCEPGFEYKENWDSCIDINECKTNNGGCEQTCTNKVGSFECSCESPYVLNEDGKTCSDFNNCKEDSCRNHGNCIDELNGFSCECFENYSGANCEECADGYEFYNDKCLKKPERFDIDLGNDISSSPNGFAVDNEGNIFVVGSISGHSDTIDIKGGEDFFLAKLDSDLNLKWTKSLGTTSNDSFRAIKIDSNDNIYVIGTTEGNFSGENEGESDIVLMRFDNHGDIIWKQQQGSPDKDIVLNFDIDSEGNIYTIGYREFDTNTGESKKLSLTKFDKQGNKIWNKEEDVDGTRFSYYIAIDSKDEIYIATATKSNLSDTQNLGNNDEILIKYNKDGEKLWVKQWGTETYDDTSGIKIYNDEIYVLGFVNGQIGDFGITMGDISLTKFDSDGNIVWNKIFNDITNNKMGSDIVISPSNKNIFISANNRSETNMILKKLDMDGKLIWTKEWPSGNDVFISLQYGLNDTLYGLGFSYESYTPLIIKFNW